MNTNSEESLWSQQYRKFPSHSVGDAWNERKEREENIIVIAPIDAIHVGRTEKNSTGEIYI